ncbi:uncharacterized protein LACBIDRAFT_332754 [Laccaria bicolor S238N-H82]|uniref:Predicted protein n=1 Tax=Laccaria bicolor (strain S238N-H82 / ATCC MYA-4686) TaxID=486041 RepID=B0DTZ4_LACBS|nr:uncharacterized protein LACBIDRAFT_332754 [Laccaria bicolor S238N-H82]EDR01997.1 predicted protein [Laccaria bicolor S238N-H82]|eukprot:XP_001887388.1 predicted protein [Laccaria bicolor S238N-H82]
MPLTPQKLLPRNAGAGPLLSPTRQSSQPALDAGADVPPVPVDPTWDSSVAPDFDAPASEVQAGDVNSTVSIMPKADNDGQSHTRAVIKKGKAVTACNGPICQSQPAKEPVRNCVTCAFEFCKKCCLAYQSAIGRLCAQHPPPVTLGVGATPSHAELSLDTPTAAGND